MGNNRQAKKISPIKNTSPTLSYKTHINPNLFYLIKPPALQVVMFCYLCLFLHYKQIQKIYSCYLL